MIPWPTQPYFMLSIRLRHSAAVSVHLSTKNDASAVYDFFCKEAGLFKALKTCIVCTLKKKKDTRADWKVSELIKNFKFISIFLRSRFATLYSFLSDVSTF